MGALASCGMKNEMKTTNDRAAAELLGNPNFPAISYGGYRGLSRSEQPTLDQLKEDMKILHAMGIRFLRTYNVQLPHAGNVVQAIHELKEEDNNFEMYVMLGAWIDCAGAWTDAPDHSVGDAEANAQEIERAVALAAKFPDIVKVIAVGNEAMVHWAASYFVAPSVILRWVNHLQGLKANGTLPANLWITSSDNFASWGGGGAEYHNENLNALIKAVDYVSMHTYPFHDTHYNPVFWSGEALGGEEVGKGNNGAVENAMAGQSPTAKTNTPKLWRMCKASMRTSPSTLAKRAGRASATDSTAGGVKGSRRIQASPVLPRDARLDPTCGHQLLYFEAFDEPWKSAANPTDSENHFGCSRSTVRQNTPFGRWSSTACLMG